MTPKILDISQFETFEEYAKAVEKQRKKELEEQLKELEEDD